ncbi:FtsB family cell division protein [Caviibacter abscessus]|uniref:FtsB family cell division protein n=1 Tax=Caviibacter abscessus TaxID=1766719 RepID=UPI00082E5799|nr:septum formation initiator family protein [Caviibacter abscessus]
MKTKIKSLIIFLFGILMFFVFIVPIFSKQKQIIEEKKKHKELQQLVENEKIKKKKLEEEIEQSNKNENVEKIAREELNMKKEGERIYKVIDEENKEEK